MVPIGHCQPCGLTGKVAEDCIKRLMGIDLCVSSLRGRSPALYCDVGSRTRGGSCRRSWCLMSRID